MSAPSYSPLSSALPAATAEYGVALDRFNTFGIAARAHAMLRVGSVSDLQQLHETGLAAFPQLVLGGGSNLLLRADFPGLVLKMEIPGIRLAGEDAQNWYVCAGAGVVWHELVVWTLQQGLPGLENLALIPGTVGAAPIQNIGAYGLELQQRLAWVAVYDRETAQVQVLQREACEFAYRDSVFKHAWRERGIIVEVCFALPKRWHAQLSYTELARHLQEGGHAEPDARQIFEAVVAIRRRKLPDPALLGNAGSFFKNPLVSAEQVESLLARFPQLVHYAQADGSHKLAAGWLIEQCGWKGRRVGAAGVYEKQALVLVNHGGASGAELAALAAQIQEDVRRRFGVTLEPEPVWV